METNVKIYNFPQLQVLEYTNPEGYFGVISARIFGELVQSDLVKDRKKAFVAIQALLRAHKQFPENAEILSISIGANRLGHELLVIAISTRIPVSSSSSESEENK